MIFKIITVHLKKKREYSDIDQYFCIVITFQHLMHLATFSIKIEKHDLTK